MNENKKNPNQVEKHEPMDPFRLKLPFTNTILCPMTINYEEAIFQERANGPISFFKPFPQKVHHELERKNY